MFVTRAVRVIDLITNLDMSSFEAHNGLTAFINRLEYEVNECRKEQPFVIQIKSGGASTSNNNNNNINTSSSSRMANEIDIQNEQDEDEDDDVVEEEEEENEEEEIIQTEVQQQQQQTTTTTNESQNNLRADACIELDGDEDTLMNVAASAAQPLVDRYNDGLDPEKGMRITRPINSQMP